MFIYLLYYLFIVSKYIYRIEILCYFYFQILHGEQYLEIYKRLPTEAKIETHFKVQDVINKKKGAVILMQRT
jgi:hypothetical protein